MGGRDCILVPIAVMDQLSSEHSRPEYMRRFVEAAGEALGLELSTYSLTGDKQNRPNTFPPELVRAAKSKDAHKL